MPRPPSGRRPLSRGARHKYGVTVKRIWPFVVGAILVLIGIIWTLQGIGVLGGSAMSGQAMWAIVGPIVGVIGVVLIVVGAARRRTGDRD